MEQEREEQKRMRSAWEAEREQQWSREREWGREREELQRQLKEKERQRSLDQEHTKHKEEALARTREAKEHQQQELALEKRRLHKIIAARDSEIDGLLQHLEESKAARAKCEQEKDKLLQSDLGTKQLHQLHKQELERYALRVQVTRSSLPRRHQPHPAHRPTNH